MYIIYITMHSFYLLYLKKCLLLLLSFYICLQCTMDNLEMHKTKYKPCETSVFSLLTPSLQAMLCDKISHNALVHHQLNSLWSRELESSQPWHWVLPVSPVCMCVYVGEKCTNNTIDKLRLRTNTRKAMSLLVAEGVTVIAGCSHELVPRRSKEIIERRGKMPHHSILTRPRETEPEGIKTEYENWNKMESKESFFLPSNFELVTQ